MKAPICKVCINSEVLCAGCQDKLNKNEVVQSDVDLVRALVRLSEKYPALDKTEFKKTISMNELLLVVVPKGTAGQFIGRRGIFIKELSDSIGKKVKVVEETPDTKELVQRILFPARLLGLNVVYTADEKETYKVRIAGFDRKKIMDQNSLESLFKDLLGGETSIIFE